MSSFQLSCQTFDFYIIILFHVLIITFHCIIVTSHNSDFNCVIMIYQSIFLMWQKWASVQYCFCFQPQPFHKDFMTCANLWHLTFGRVKVNFTNLFTSIATVFLSQQSLSTCFIYFTQIYTITELNKAFEVTFTQRRVHSKMAGKAGLWIYGIHPHSIKVSLCSPEIQRDTNAVL